MAPQRFTSVRQKSRQTARLAALRDDTGLVALRYEQTKQAEPPIPLPPPRNPLRVARPHSTIPLPTTPLVIAPPPVPPPQEEHPLFRRQLSQTDGRKRDSALTPTSSSATIKDECEEAVVYEKIPDCISDASSAYSGDEIDHSSFGDASPVNNSFASPYPAPLRVSTVPRRPKTPEEPVEAVSPSRASSLTQKIGKSFSLRSVGKNKSRLRKKPLGDSNDKVASPSPDAHAPSPVVRGSPKSPDSPKFGSRSLNLSGGRGQQSGSLVSLQPTPTSTDNEFVPISTPIPEDSLWDDLGDLSFSKRGSIMFGGRTNPLAAMTKSDETPAASAVAPSEPPAGVMPALVDRSKEPPPPPAATSSSTNDESQSVPSIRVVSMEVERESQKVRSLYESGDTFLHWQDGGQRVSASFGDSRLEPTEEVPSDEEENVAYGFPCFSRLERPSPLVLT